MPIKSRAAIASKIAELALVSGLQMNDETINERNDILGVIGAGLIAALVALLALL
jgi:hypothetical protein